jgi:hypothetical protein
MSSITGLVYLINKQTKTILYAGEVPEVYGNITGLTNVDYAVLQDLHGTWASPEYLDLGFLTEADALALGVSQMAIGIARAGAWELKWNSLDATRSELIDDQRWRVDRYNDETLMNWPHTEDITPVLTYIQALRDLPTTYPDPYNIVWPTVPPLPGG